MFCFVVPNIMFDDQWFSSIRDLKSSSSLVPVSVLTVRQKKSIKSNQRVCELAIANRVKRGNDASTLKLRKVAKIHACTN
jgi:hypothetical protein